MEKQEKIYECSKVPFQCHQKAFLMTLFDKTILFLEKEVVCWFDHVMGVLSASISIDTI